MAISINPVVMNSNGIVNTTVAQHVQAGTVNKVAQQNFAAQLQAGISNSAENTEAINKNAETIEKLSGIELAPDIKEDEGRKGGNGQSSGKRQKQEDEEAVENFDSFYVGNSLNIKV